MQLFYTANLTENTRQITFNNIESRHIVRVLRKKTGDLLHITDGKGMLYTAKIVLANDKKCVAAIVSAIEKPKPWPYYLHIAMAPTKSIDRFEWFLEKAVEIGVDEITPLLCQHSERKVIKITRLEKIIEAAMKQSLQCKLPKLNALTKFSDFIQQDTNGKLFIAHCETTERHSLKKLLAPKERVTILIGPEGDFSPAEIEMALQRHYAPITFGENRLRTETAGIVAVQTVSFINQ